MKNNNNNFVIIIPIYNVLNDCEKASLCSLSKMFDRDSSLTTVFIGIECIFKKEFNLICSILETSNVKFELFNPFYFSSIRTYNLLLTNPCFYKRFSQYRYLLIFQLDAYLIGLDLNKFMLKDYTFIGAPWFDNEGKENGASMIGNGGFSLRKSNDFLRILKNNSVVSQLFWRMYRPYNTPYRRLFKLLILYPHMLYAYIRRLPFELEWSKYNNVNEDVIFSSLFSMDDSFSIPDFKDALEFSFECYPNRCYDLNNKNLPLGCHAWSRYDLDFWKSHLPDLRKF